MSNIFLNPEAWGTAPWAPNQTITADYATAPDGTNTADRLIDSNGGGTGTVRTTQSVSLATSVSHVVSAWAQADQLDWFRIYLDGFSVNPSCYFDLINGVTGTAVSYTGIGMVEYPDSWWRCWIKFLTGADGAGACRFAVAEADNDDVVDRDGTSSIIVWGADIRPADALEPYTADSGKVSPFLGGLSFVRDTVRDTVSDTVRDTVR